MTDPLISLKGDKEQKVSENEALPTHWLEKWILSRRPIKDFNVRDFGAVADNETDDTAAIQSAIDAGIAWREKHWWRLFWIVHTFFPGPGTYKVNGCLESRCQGFKIVGDDSHD
jgi:hypothetical protein